MHVILQNGDTHMPQLPVDTILLAVTETVAANDGIGQQFDTVSQNAIAVYDRTGVEPAILAHFDTVTQVYTGSHPGPGSDDHTGDVCAGFKLESICPTLGVCNTEHLRHIR